MMLYIAYIVLFLSFINLFRMGLFLVASDIYDIKKNLRRRSEPEMLRRRTYRPLVTVLVPAHNEELVLRRNLDSIFQSTYKNIELIIINDSSTDRTHNIARYFQRKFKSRFKRVKVLNVHVRGKALALNAGLKHAKGSLFMCLDADSALSPMALEIAVNEFANKQLGCLSSNVKILPEKGMLNFLQRIEYLVGYQMKKTEAIADIQYIVGGVGSMFRTRLVQKLGGYDTDTITEDIDLSMNIINKFQGKYKIGYNPDSIVYTESVQDIKGLLRQRFRWKYGRYQVFFKHKNLFWSKNKNHGKLLSWLYLPYALFSELLYSIEPLIYFLIIFLVVTYGDATLIAWSFLIFVFYTTMNITATTSGYTLKERIDLISAAPVAYIGMYVLSIVEYGATIHGFKNLRKIYKQNKTGEGACDWTHVERKGHAVLN